MNQVEEKGDFMAMYPFNHHAEELMSDICLVL
jgi:hypothetical protein